MNRPASKENLTTLDIDALLQDTYLLVVELRQGACIPSGATLSQLCVKQVGQVRHQLELAGLSQGSIDHISYAQCALLDETVLACAKGDAHSYWASEPLQARFFNRHQAGIFLYEDMRDVLREPAPNRHVLTVFQRVLMLGFRGRYLDLGDPVREQLLVDLSARITPLQFRQSLVTQAGSSELIAALAWLRSPLIHILTVGLLLMASWWGLDYLLSATIASLLPDQG